jgi:hypothetical protein
MSSQQITNDDIMDAFHATVKRIINYLSRRNKIDNSGLLRIYKAEVNIIWRLTGYYPIDYTPSTLTKPIADSIGEYMITHESYIYTIWRWIQLGKPLDFNEFYMLINGATEPLNKHGPLINDSDNTAQ